VLLCGQTAKLIDLDLMFLLRLLAISVLLSVSLCFKLHKIVWPVHGLVTDMKTIFVYYKASQLMLFSKRIGFDYDDNMKYKSILGRIKSF
jgi:hypothetical protein